MAWGDIPLTDAQQAFAEKNHGLLLKFIADMQLDEEYYTILVERYLKAVVKYLGSERLQQYRFSTILWHNLRSELSNHLRREKLEFGPCSFEPPPPVEREAPMDPMVWERIEAVLTPKQLDAVMLRNQGFSNREISLICHISEKAVEKRFARIRKTIKNKEKNEL